MSKHLCIIPARAGSKSIIDKNLIMLPANNKGKTITRWAVEHARESNIFGHILVTSDISSDPLNFAPIML
jgi:CMP-N-acetylneuraminic acid synthetase